MRLNLNMDKAPMTANAPGQPLHQRSDGVDHTKGKGGQPHVQAQKAKIKQVAQEFEALMMEKMLHQMRASIPHTDLMSGTQGAGHGKQLFEEMLDGEYAKHMTHQGGFGLGKFLTRGLEAKEFGHNNRAAQALPSAESSPNNTAHQILLHGRSSSKGMNR